MYLTVTTVTEIPNFWMCRGYWADDTSTKLMGYAEVAIPKTIESEMSIGDILPVMPLGNLKVKTSYKSNGYCQVSGLLKDTYAEATIPSDLVSFGKNTVISVGAYYNKLIFLKFTRLAIEKEVKNEDC